MTPYLPCIVTRFGEIPPLWQNFKSLLQFFESLVSIRQTFEPNLANFKGIMAIFRYCKWPNIEKVT